MDSDQSVQFPLRRDALRSSARIRTTVDRSEERVSERVRIRVNALRGIPRGRFSSREWSCEQLRE
jgi:hypothetical protein